MIKSVLDFARSKEAGRRLSMVTAYDFTSAAIVAASQADCILVGDSAAMTMHGYDSTIPATVELMALHTAAVARGAPGRFIVGDMPFLSFRKGVGPAMECVERLMRAGASCVKLEGVRGHEDVISAVVGSGVPVMGHLGLTPQSVHSLGGYKVQGKAPEAAEEILSQARALEELGCFAVVLECVPGDLASRITRSLRVPTIGIGAGRECDGQVLVFQDLLGLGKGHTPRFVRRYLEGAALFQDAIDRFDADVKSGSFPSEKESYS